VTNYNLGTVWVINGVTNTIFTGISVGFGPVGVAFDSLNGYIYVTNAGSNNVSVINGATNTILPDIYVGLDPSGVVYDSSNRYIYVANYNSSTVSVINGANNTVIANISVGWGPLGVAYDSSNGYVYVTNWNSNNVSVINGATNTVIASISVGSQPKGIAYDSSNGYVYVADIQEGTISIISTSPQLIKKYTVIFAESGLPSGASWSVTLNGTTESSTTDTITFNEPNGTYSFSIGSVTGYTVSPSSGSVTVNGANVNQAITFTSVTTSLYNITFTESGLSTGTSWSVTFNGTTESSTTDTITFSVPNGTYSYTIGSVSGYTASPSSGFITVNGANVNQAITFTPVTTSLYTITFTESGLPSGTSWSVTFNGKTETSTTNTISFTEPNGTYSFSISSISGYSVSPSSGSITVKGTNISQNITFTSVTTTTPPSSNDYLIYIIIAVVVIAAAIGVVVAMGRRKK